jgi:CHAT domain-containing protein/Tfp pilus assembly protein PilF
MGSGRAISLAGLMAGLVGLAPVVAVPGVTPVMAQMTEQRKTDADLLLQQGVQQTQSNQYQLASQSFEQALNIYQQISDRPGEARALLGLSAANLGLGNGIKAIELSQRAVAIAKAVKNPELEKFAQPFLEVAQRQTEASRLVQQGVQQLQDNQNQEANQSFEQALIIYRKIKHQSGEGAALIGLGEANLRLGNRAKALELSQKAIAIAKELNNPEIERLARQVLDAAQKTVGGSTQVYPQEVEANQWIQQGVQQLQNGQNQAAGQSFERALVIYSQIKNQRGVVAALLGLGEANLRLGNSAKALELSQQAIAIAQELKDPELENLARQALDFAQISVNNPIPASPKKAEAARLLEEGIQQYKASEFETALRSWQQALQLYRELKYRPLEGRVLSNLGSAYDALGNYSKAIEYHEQALTIAREIKDRFTEGVVLGNLGNSHRVLGGYEKSINYQEQRLAIAREIQDRQGEGAALGNLGNAFFSLGDYSKTINYYEQALAILREIKDRFGEGKTLGNLGEAYRFLGEYSKAMEYHKQHLTIAREIKDRQGEGVSLGNLGSVYHRLSNYGKAIEYQEQRLVIAREVGDRFSEGTALANLGEAYRFLGDYSKAIKYHQQSLAIAREIKDPRGEGVSLNNLGTAFFQSGDLPAAAKTLMTGVTTWELLRQTGAGNDANKVSIFETQAMTYRTLQQVLIAQNLPNAALEIAERGKGRAFVELLAQRLAASRSGTSVPVQSTLAPPNLQQIQQIAQAQGATLVQYSIISNYFQLQGRTEAREETLYIWVISPTGVITFRKTDLRPLWHQQNTSLANLVDQSREAMGARGRSDIEVALSPERLKQLQEQQTGKLKQLYQLLIEPIADLLPKAPTQRVIFMPQGELFLVPFPALLDANNTPLLEKHTLLTAPSIQVLELTRRQKKGVRSQESGGGKALVVGNPTMPKVVTRVGDAPMPLSDLPGAKREALAIASLLNTQAVTGAQATKTAIAQQMPNARIIHLATHGLLDDTKGLGVPGAIALAPSGNGQLNDGLLTSDEILDMKLNAELVVLSACDTGRGRITGDGVIGLSRSLITAGVPSIVVSLWKVPDEPTAFLMTEFYKNLKKSPDKAQALRQAMLTTKQRYPDPLNWAAFTLIGEAE